MISDEIIQALVDNELQENQKNEALEFVRSNAHALEKYNYYLYQKHILQNWWNTKKKSKN